MLSSQAGSPGFITGLQIGSQNNNAAMAPNGKMFYAAPKNVSSLLPWTAASAMDVSSYTFGAFSTKTPFHTTVPLQATAITGAKRLTSDGGTPSSFVYDAAVTVRGSGYTTNPTATVTGCTGADVESALGLGGVLGTLQVKYPGSACVAEATVAVTGGGGASGAGVLIVAGNSLNFAPKSSVSVACTLIADTLLTGGTDSVAWSISFMATMGATASTTAIVGSPAWTLINGTAGAAAKFSGSAPAVPVADTTLGSINMSITPTTGTWRVSGECGMTRSAQT
jgi:hypothetical protein